jgi:hypothetical protein
MPPATMMNSERRRVAQNHSPGERWDLWGPYLSERSWGTVREDYSASGDAWNYFARAVTRLSAFGCAAKIANDLSDARRAMRSTRSAITNAIGSMNIFTVILAAVSGRRIKQVGPASSPS